MKKYLISIVTGILVLLITYFISDTILNLKKDNTSDVSEISKLVSVIEVKNSSNSIKLSVDGRLKSKDKIHTYSEVQGIVKFNKNIFEEGEVFK